ncbi:hypothetical protein V8D89_012988 [Ganoderma adspersum]
MDTDFSSNRCASPVEEYEVSTRHPDIYFEDGNLSIVAGRQYFIVHRGLLCRHSEVLRVRIESIKTNDERLLEGLAVLYLDDSPEDLAHFLRALYGLSHDTNAEDFAVISAVLRLATNYGVETLRETALRTLSLSWPSTLQLWEVREKAATTIDGVYVPRPGLPHPLMVIKLAREVDAPQLLPSAFYDLSRYLPSQLTEGHTTLDGAKYDLDIDDLCRVLRGKEQAARFFSTFIVTELEGRPPSQLCMHRIEVQPSLKRACQMAFEAVTFELIRDVNGMVCNRNCDPLFSIAESVTMQTRDDHPGIENKAAYRACEACRLEYGLIVEVAREEFWRQLPSSKISLTTMYMQLQLEFACSTDSDSEVELWNDQEDEADIELELSDDDLFHADETIQDENLQAIPNILYSTSGNEDEDDSGPDEAELGGCEDENDLRYVFHILDKSAAHQSLANRDETQIPMRSLVFPRATKNPSARPFAQLFRVIDLIHQALVSDVPVTKRDIYYNDVQLFRSQAVVDRLIDDLAATLHLTRADLNVRASSKGLFCGSGLAVHLKSGETLEISDGDASLIPQAEDIERFAVARTLAWVLVVEKEAVFQTLCKLRLATHQAFPGWGLIVTGYPDVATRQLVKTLSDNLPARVPILALVDGDAYGIDILSVYKHGSTRMRHENDHLAADRLQWVGLWASELASLGIGKDALLPITKHDEKKASEIDFSYPCRARTLLKRANVPAQWRSELQHMLFSRRKAEIEVLGAAWVCPAGGVADLVATDDHLRLPDRPQAGRGPGTPLLRYLIRKICQACADSAREN